MQLQRRPTDGPTARQNLKIETRLLYIHDEMDISHEFIDPPPPTPRPHNLFLAARALGVNLLCVFATIGVAGAPP